MPDIALEGISVSKKFRKGESFDSLRDLIPALVGRSWKKAIGAQLQKKEFWALKDVCFEVKRGEALGVIGHNGAGKSTLLKLLSGIMKPTQGTISVRGKLSALIEVGAGFHPDLTGRENIYLNGVILGMTRDEVARKFDEIVEFSGLQEFLDMPVKRYSSGMYARLGFAVAAHVDPDILLVDEVLSVGDWAYQSKCSEKMKELIKGGATVVFISHNLRAVASLCQKCILLEHGTVVKNGPAEEVISAYLVSSAAGSAGENSNGISIVDMVAQKSGKNECKFAAGDRIVLSIRVRSEIDCNNVAVHLYTYDSNFYNVFQTSTEFLRSTPLSFFAGEVKTFSFELSLHLGCGIYYCGAVVRSVFHGGLEQFDRKFPGLTLYIDAPGEVNGPSNLYPRLLDIASVRASEPSGARAAQDTIKEDSALCGRI